MTTRWKIISIMWISCAIAAVGAGTAGVMMIPTIATIIVAFIEGCIT